MRLASLKDGRAALAGDGGATAVQDLDSALPSTLPGLLAEWGSMLPRLAALDPSAGPGRASNELGPPIPRPGKIICVGRNYADHAAETGSEVPKSPILFSKFATAVIGPGDRVERPRGILDLDYEAELAVVIGTAGRHIAEADALSHVAGYMCADDISARTAQLGDGQWLRGKSFDTFCPTGPYLVTADEVPDPQALRIRCRVDGETRQDSNTAHMVFGVAELIAFCSRAFTLEPGDVILTGTPDGVALGMKEPRWLQPGQTVEVEIDGLGVLANPIVDEA